MGTTYNNISKSIVLLFAVVTMLFACSSDIPKINRITSKEDLPTAAVDRFKSTFTENGLIKGKLKAKRLEQYEDVIEPYTKFPKGISIVFFDKKGNIESSMTAKMAVYYIKKETWEAIGDVVFSNIQGNILRTEHLYGDEKAHKIYTDQYVRITRTNGTVVEGKSGFESNSDFTIYKFIDVSGIIAVKEEFHSDADSIPQNNKAVDKK